MKTASIRWAWRKAPNDREILSPGRWEDAAILEEHAFLAELAAAEIPVVPAAGIRRWHDTGAPRRLPTPSFPGGRPRRNSGDPATREWMGRFSVASMPSVASHPFAARPVLDIASFGEEPRDWLIRHQAVPPDLLAARQGTIDMALDGVRHAGRVPANRSTLRLHGDCHLGNVLWTDDGPHFVDFDDSRMGPAVRIYGCCSRASGWRCRCNCRTSSPATRTSATSTGANCISSRHCARSRLIHYAAWIARRWDDPAFPAAFPWFGTAHYWQARILELKEQIAAMQEPPLIA